MQPFRDISIKRKLVLIIMLTSCVVLLLAGAALITYEVVSFRRDMPRDLAVTAEMIGFNCSAAISFNDPEAAEQTLKGLQAQPHIVAACVYDKAGKVVATYLRTPAKVSFPPPSPDNTHRFTADSLELFRKITFAEEHIGTIYVQSNLEEMQRRLRQYAWIGGLILLAVIVIGYLLASRLQRVISEPIAQLVGVAHAVGAEQNYAIRATKYGDDELGRLIDGFNGMLAQIQARDAELQNARADLEKRVEERTVQLQAEVKARAQVADALKSSEAFLNSVLQNLPIIVFIKEAQTSRLIMWNKAGEELFGQTSAQVAGKTDYDFFPKEQADVFIAKDREVIQNRKLVEYEEEFTGSQGKRLLLTRKVPIFDDKGEPLYLLGISEDITERKLVEAALRDAKEAAEAAAKAKSEFLANMSHEIRTPMNGVIGMTGLLMDTSLNQLQREFADTIRTSADALLTIINDILDFSKIEAGKLDFEHLDFDLMDVVEGTVDMLAERAQAKGIELISSILPDVSTRLQGDPGRLRQILTNLVGNGIKFTERGEVVVRVTKENETATQITLRFSVTDTGVGIPAEVQARLFQAFTQADNSTTRKFGGTGLGLAIAKQLVAMMNGQIGVQSAPGKGATFWFTAQFEKQLGEAKPVPVYNDDLFNLRVLVVDDNATNRQILRHQIFAWKMQKGSAASGHEALKTLRAAAAAGAPYDLALLDMQMPEMDGLTLARTIKADPAISNTRLIILTSLGQMLTAAELRAAGIEAYLVKPVKQSRLFDCLVNVMGRAEAEKTFIRAAKPVAASPAVSPDMKLQILLVEDNSINQKVALGQLQKLGYTAHAVGNGLEALEALNQIPYDLVFMDCQMPEMDGYEASREIRRQEQVAGRRCRWKSPLYVIAMTANAMQGDREKCLAAGMSDYVSKPVKASELQAAIDRAKLSLEDRIDLAPAPLPSQQIKLPASAVVPEAVEPDSDPTPVEVDRLVDICDGDKEQIRELISLYRTQANEVINGMEAALRSGSAKEIEHLAHKGLGISSNCGMMAIVPAFTELQNMARKGELQGAPPVHAEASKQLRRIERFLVTYLKSL